MTNSHYVNGIALALIIGVAAMAYGSGQHETDVAPENQTRHASGASDFDLSWRTVDGGGGTSTGGDFTLAGTIGQPDAGAMSGGDFSLSGGFWQVFASSDCGDCPTDVDGSGATDATDLAQLLGVWGPVAPGNCLDSNGDNIIDATDLAVLLGAWGPCP